MNCEILHTLYVRSNGDVPCDDDAGERIILGQITPSGGRGQLTALFANPNYVHIRNALKRGELPWPDACADCALLRPNDPCRDYLGLKQIRKLQIEPSLACRLRCPSCSNGLQVRTRPKPLRMEPALFERVLQSLRTDRFSVQEIEYCGQGEPLLHPQFSEFVRIARAQFPATRQRLITSGDFEYRSAIGIERLNEIVVACDGCYQGSYEQYRVGGRIDRVIRFMRDAPRWFKWRRQVLVWKYILFEFNDSDEEILAAQKLAQELRVHRLLFVFTHSPGRSRRYTPENVTDFPVYFPNVRTNATPVHYQQAGTAVSRDRTLCVVDLLEWDTQGRLRIVGWALSHDSLTSIRVTVNGQAVGTAVRDLAREDVLAAHPEFGDTNAGFEFCGHAKQPRAEPHVIGLSLLAGETVLKLWHRTVSPMMQL
jgi:wyosine [tRNA(Phe)-imidazoG37] synthetase (radical SAM superfamily)